MEMASGVFSVPNSKTVAPPELAYPIEKCVAVDVPPAQIGNWICAALVNVFEVTVHPAAERATATRAYPLYETSLVDWVPPTPGAAVCRARKRDPADAEPRGPPASPRPAIAVLFSRCDKREFANAVENGMVVLYSKFH